MSNFHVVTMFILQELKMPIKHFLVKLQDNSSKILPEKKNHLIDRSSISLCFRKIVTITLVKIPSFHTFICKIKTIDFQNSLVKINVKVYQVPNLKILNSTDFQ